jgi:hypothetical protein
MVFVVVRLLPKYKEPVTWLITPLIACPYDPYGFTALQYAESAMQCNELLNAL